MSDKKINLEELAETSTEESVEETHGEEKENKKQVHKKKKEVTPNEEINRMFQLPFTVVMQNLKLKEDFVLKIAEQLFIKGEVDYKIELPLGNYMVLTTRKASEELDYYTFLAQSLGRDITEIEFSYLLKMRNLAAILEELKIGDFQENFKGKEIDYKYEKLLGLPSVIINMLIMKSSEFQSALLLLMHPKAIDFLTKTLQK